MKTTLKISLVLLLSTIYFSCNNNETVNEKNTTFKSDAYYKLDQEKWVQVGKVENNVPSIMVNKDKLINSLEANLLKYSQLYVGFTDVYIYENFDNYHLVFKGAKYTTSLYLEMSDTKVLYARGDTTCTTTECSQEPLGCVVKYDLSKPGAPGYCSPCDNGGKCTKTVSNKALIIVNDEDLIEY